MKSTPLFVTLTFTIPVLTRDGAKHVISVSDTYDAGTVVPPKEQLNPAEYMKLPPIIDTLVPPLIIPRVGLICSINSMGYTENIKLS